MICQGLGTVGRLFLGPPAGRLRAVPRLEGKESIKIIDD
jgi:hypothetical protein